MLSIIAVLGTLASTILGTLVGFRKGAQKPSEDLEEAKAILDTVLPVIINIPGIKQKPLIQSILKGNEE